MMGASSFSSPVAAKVTMMEVVAPCDMEAGYSLVVTHEGRTFPVTVPEGGVKESQVFEVPLESTRVWLNSSSSKSIDIKGWSVENETTPLFFNLGGNLVADNEQGQWRDGLWDCFSLGFYHSILWNAIFCPTILLGQVLTRLGLNMIGGPSSDYQADQNDTSRVRMRTWSDTSWSEASSIVHGSTSPTIQHRKIWRSVSEEPGLNHSDISPIPRSEHTPRRHHPTAFSRILILCCSFWIMFLVLCPPLPMLVQDFDTGEILGLYIPRHVSWVRWNLFRLCIGSFCFFTIVVLARLRYIVRQREKISTCLGSSQCCGVVEDITVATCCTCCVISQLSRQTGGSRQAACCSETGLMDEQLI